MCRWGWTMHVALKEPMFWWFSIKRTAGLPFSLKLDFTKAMRCETKRRDFKSYFSCLSSHKSNRKSRRRIMLVGKNGRGSKHPNHLRWVQRLNWNAFKWGSTFSGPGAEWCRITKRLSFCMRRREFIISCIQTKQAIFKYRINGLNHIFASV